VSDTAYEELVEPEEIEAIMDGGHTVVLDFWSPTCGPCMAMAKDFEEVAAQFEREEVRFCKVNTETHGYLAAPFKVRAVPTILFIHDGEIVDAVVGKMTAEQLGTKAEWLLERKNRKPGLLSRLLRRQ
jgi:thioredoxin 1